ncbi:MAG TPA: glycoside hydrolase 100 family protein [Ktedonobacteraceae bacterium]|nr:glycoside hydrolase 100 family protein [Ktedonobacteraceae bacterium]
MTTHPAEDTVAYQHSLALLHRCLSPAGFVASPEDIDNYARIWARDGMITGPAALASGDTDLVEGLRRTLDTLAQHQGPHGEIPSNVTGGGKRISYGRLVGRVDASLWYVIGVCAYLQYSMQADREHYRSSVERILFLAGCWEYNNRGLLYTPIAGNWADEYVQQGYVLSDQLLYATALFAAGHVFHQQAWYEKARELHRTLAVNYWPRAALSDDPLVYHPHAYRHQVEQGESSHWLAAFSPAGYNTSFDGLAHALVLLTDLGDHEQRARATQYIKSLETQLGSALLPAFWPVIQPGDPGWGELQANHLYGQMKNLPYQYHNAGLWPVLTGLEVVGLVRHGAWERARDLLTAINAANAQGRARDRWEFAEYLHGQTHLPMGTKYVAWSAAAGVLAHQAVWRGISYWPL